MKALTVVWNESGEECVGFTDPSDARFAAGGKPSPFHQLSGVSDLADYFRDGYADGAKLEEVVVLSAEGLQVFKDLQDCLVKCLTGGEVSAKRAGKAIKQAAELREGLK